jgi:hypothetical protein
MSLCSQRHASAPLPPEKKTVTYFTKAGWAPEPVWMGAESLASTGIRSSDHPARVESPYGLRYPSTILEVNADQTKYMLMSGENNVGERHN